jgi:hypothetical protein
LPGCFPVDKSYGWIQASAKIHHFVLKAKSFAPTAAISFESNLQPPTVMLSGEKAITQVVNCMGRDYLFSVSEKGQDAKYRSYAVLRFLYINFI